MKYQDLAVAPRVAIRGTALALGQDSASGDGTTTDAWRAMDPDYAKCDTGKMQSPTGLTRPDALGPTAGPIRPI